MCIFCQKFLGIKCERDPMLFFIEKMIKQLKYQFERRKRPFCHNSTKAVFLFPHNVVLILVHIGCYMDTKHSI